MPYTTERIPTRKKWVVSTATIAALSIAGALGVDVWLNDSSLISSITPDLQKPDQTVTGDAVPYAFGTVQLEVVRIDGKLAEINLIQADANYGREQAFALLQKSALEAQGTDFANLSGATYTVDAFKTALGSAISKLS
jgi:uncharacterized protein with FMN-binding domain